MIRLWSCPAAAPSNAVPLHSSPPAAACGVYQARLQTVQQRGCGAQRARGLSGHVTM